MKKKLITIAAFSYLALINISAQKPDQAITEKKKYTSLVKIKTSTGETIEAALSRRTPDTVYISLLEKDYVKAGGKQIKILKDDGEKSIAVDQIINYKHKNDPNIIYRDDLNKRKKQLKSKNAWKIVGIAGLSVAVLAALSAAAVAGMAAGL